MNHNWWNLDICFIPTPWHILWKPYRNTFEISHFIYAWSLPSTMFVLMMSKHVTSTPTVFALCVMYNHHGLGQCDIVITVNLNSLCCGDRETIGDLKKSTYKVKFLFSFIVLRHNRCFFLYISNSCQINCWSHTGPICYMNRTISALYFPRLE